VYTCLAAQSVGRTGRVVSFEPVRDNLDLLRESVELNQPATEVVDVVEAAAGPDESTVRIFLDADNSGTHSIGGTGEEYVDVRQTTIDTVVDELDLDRIDLVKVDVEGYEPGVLAGADRSLRRFTPMLLCEFDAEMIRATGGNPDQFASMLRAYGEVFEIDERSGEMVPIEATSIADLHNSNVVVVPAGREVARS
ncbi:MAG: FkbM family methyltransferase, partial [Acidimicrobiales bacterium]|nr:FkbM family methyltransferase [Acidimicrobiales bacterium]